MRRHFEGGGISRCGEISRKYGISVNLINFADLFIMDLILMYVPYI